MKFVTASICLRVSVHRAYLAWIKLDAFRAIITRLHRQPSAPPSRPAGNSRRRPERRRAQLIEQVPDRYLAWRNDAGNAPISSAEFEPLSDHGSRVTVFVNLEQSGALPATLGSPAAAQAEVHLALLDFKAQAEGARFSRLRDDALGLASHRP